MLRPELEVFVEEEVSLIAEDVAEETVSEAEFFETLVAVVAALVENVREYEVKRG